jgi:hypothetical protein
MLCVYTRGLEAPGEKRYFSFCFLFLGILTDE